MASQGHEPYPWTDETPDKGSLNLTARDCMVSELVTAAPDMLAAEAIALLIKHRISGMPVVDTQRHLLGVLSERDCMKTLLDARYHNLPTAFVKDLMSTEVETISPETDLFKIAETFLNRKFRRLPVVDEGQLIGQISRRDVLRILQKMR